MREESGSALETSGAVGETRDESAANRQNERKRDRRAGALLGLAYLVLYLLTLCPTVYLGDSGEITAAVATGGTIHPPGYPLFSLLGRAALVLVPMGEPAFRLGCLVAGAAALTVVVLFALAREVGASRPAALLAAASFGTAYSFWSQSTRVEVYSMHVLLASLALLSALRYQRTGAPGWLVACALAISLGLAHHLTIVLLGPGILVLCGPRLWKDPAPLRRWLPALLVLPLGPAMYLLMIQWAREHPLQSWGHPSTLEHLWNHATAKVYRHLLEVPGPQQFIQDTQELLRLYVDNFPFGLFLLPLLGLPLLWKRDRALAGGLGLAGLVIALYNYCYTIPDIAGYYLTVWLVLAVFAAVALDFLRPFAEQFARPAVAGIVGAALLVGLPLARNWNDCNLSRATWVREFARHKLESCDPNTVLITQGDDDTSPILYVHDLLKVRPDVLQIDRSLISGMYSVLEKDSSRWYLYRLKHLGVPVSTELPTDPQRLAYLGNDGALIDLIEGPLRDRPLAITFAQTSITKVVDSGFFLQWARQQNDLLPLGIILRIHPKKEPVDLKGLVERSAELWATFELPEPRSVRTDQEMNPDYVWKHYREMLINLGGLYELLGEKKQAAMVYKTVQEWAPRAPLPADAAALVAAQAADGTKDN